MKDKCLERFNVIRKEKESCDELEELEMEEVVEDPGPGLGCTSPHARRRTHNQVTKIIVAPDIKQPWTTLILYTIVSKCSLPMGSFLVITKPLL